MGTRKAPCRWDAVAARGRFTAFSKLYISVILSILALTLAYCERQGVEADGKWPLLWAFKVG